MAYIVPIQRVVERLKQIVLVIGKLKVSRQSPDLVRDAPVKSPSPILQACSSVPLLVSNSPTQHRNPLSPPYSLLPVSQLRVSFWYRISLHLEFELWHLPMLARTQLPYVLVPLGPSVLAPIDFDGVIDPDTLVEMMNVPYSSPFPCPCPLAWKDMELGNHEPLP